MGAVQEDLDFVHHPPCAHHPLLEQGRKAENFYVTLGRWKARTRKIFKTKGVKFKVRMEVKAESLEDLIAQAKTPKGMPADIPRISSGIAEFDRLLGGNKHKKIGWGLPEGTMTIIAGEPGAGKSTLSDQLALSYADQGFTVALAVSEESKEQVFLRLRRLVPGPRGFSKKQIKNLKITPTIEVNVAKNRLHDVRADVLIMDSLQGFQDINGGYKPRSIATVKRMAHIAKQYVKDSGQQGKKCIAICIGQINKNGAVAGPEMLQHLCDILLMMQGSIEHRTVGPIKNRYNATTEKIICKITGTGLSFEDARTVQRDRYASNVAGQVEIPDTMAMVNTM